MAVADRRFRVMGGEARVRVIGGTPGLLERAQARLEELERRWSRFLPESEISRLNRLAGRPVVVSAETFDLVHRGIDAWRETAGRFDPTVLEAVIAAGYDRTFAAVPADGPAAIGPTGPTPGCSGIELDPVTGAVLLPVGVAFDPGGLGKGYAADRVVEELLEAGAEGALVDLGGDLRVAGDPGSDPGWVVGVEDARDASALVAEISLAAGGVATSSCLSRSWTRGGEVRHHLIDPTTGRSASSGLVAVTAVAGAAWRAEVAAKAALIAGLEDGRRLLEALGATGLLIDEAGVAHEAAGAREVLA